MTYDKNGNILKLDRYGLKVDMQNGLMTNSMGIMDRLTYKYAPKSNLLVDVHDTADIQPRFTSNGQTPAQYYGGFKDKHTATDKYVYGDLNGNMTADKNKDITSISYNHLNLPSVVTFTNNRNITYIYDATGVKLKKVITQSATSTNTEYAGGIIYENGVLEMIPQPEGYIQPGVNGGYDYVYQYKDQLGNIRLSYSDTNNNGSVNFSEILSEKHYYPFGLEHKGYGAANNVNSVGDRFGFQEQELQDDLGLDWIQFKWRNHDPALGRFMSIDPLTEDYMDWGPYVFSGNRVIDARELEGLEPHTIHDTPEAAAENFADQYNGLSIRMKGEIGTVFYSQKIDGVTKYSYIIPTSGGPGSGAVDPMTAITDDNFIPEGATIFGDGHTHGNDTNNYRIDTVTGIGSNDADNFMSYPSDFDKTDEEKAANKDYQMSFTIMPNGSIKSYSPDGKTKGDDRIKLERTISTNAPSDNKSESRMNTKSANNTPEVLPLTILKDDFKKQ